MLASNLTETVAAEHGLRRQIVRRGYGREAGQFRLCAGESNHRAYGPRCMAETTSAGSDPVTYLHFASATLRARRAAQPNDLAVRDHHPRPDPPFGTGCGVYRPHDLKTLWRIYAARRKAKARRPITLTEHPEEVRILRCDQVRHRSARARQPVQKVFQVRG